MLNELLGMESCSMLHCTSPRKCSGHVCICLCTWSGEGSTMSKPVTWTVHCTLMISTWTMAPEELPRLCLSKLILLVQILKTGSIAPHFYPICFGNVVLLSPIYLGQRGGTLYFKIGTSSLVACIVSFPFEWWANQIGWLQKKTNWTWEAPHLVDRGGELERFNGRGCSLCIMGAQFDSHKIDETCFQFLFYFWVCLT
jgi:hypothetical protein